MAKTVMVHSSQPLLIFHPVADESMGINYRWIPDEFLKTKIGWRLYEMLQQELGRDRQ